MVWRSRRWHIVSRRSRGRPLRVDVHCATASHPAREIMGGAFASRAACYTNFLDWRRILSVPYRCDQSASPRIAIAIARRVGCVDIAELVFRRRLGCVVRSGGEEPIRKRQLRNGAKGEQVLASKRTGRIRQVVGGAHRPNPLGDLRVAVTRQIREKVVFDLVAKVSAEDRHHRTGVKVRGAQHLSQIPFRLRLTLERGGGEFFRAIREVPTADHHIRPHIA